MNDNTVLSIKKSVREALHSLGYQQVRDLDDFLEFQKFDVGKRTIRLEIENFSEATFTLLSVVQKNSHGKEFAIDILMAAWPDEKIKKIIPSLANQISFIKQYETMIFDNLEIFEEAYDRLNEIPQ